jgi:DNA repair protein RadC
VLIEFLIKQNTGEIDMTNTNTNTKEDTNTTFTVGTTYYTRSICDHNCIYAYTVVKRTAKFITIQEEGESRTKRVGVSLFNGIETAMPEGRYSMAPSINAQRTERPKTDWEIEAERDRNQAEVDELETAMHNGGVDLEIETVTGEIAENPFCSRTILTARSEEKVEYRSLPANKKSTFIEKKKISHSQDLCTEIQTICNNDEKIKSKMEYQEVFGVLALNNKNQILEHDFMFIGSNDEVRVNPSHIFKFAILNNAARIVIFHNHPSGYTTPSPDDIALTTRVRECGELMGVPLLDHLVLGDTENDRNYCSIRDLGYF